MTRCHRCSAAIPADSRFCEECGAPIGGTSSQAATPDRGAEEREWIVGRGDATDLRIDLPMISGQHLAVRSHGTETWIRDLGSSNGTWVGADRSRRVGKDWVTVDGAAVLHLGSYRLPVTFLRERLGLGGRPSAYRPAAAAPRGERIVIGRDPACDVTIDAPQVSREHVELIRQGSGWLVRDLGSSNGTWIGGRRVGTVLVERPTAIHLGSYVVHVDVGGHTGDVRVEPLAGQIRVDVHEVGVSVPDRASGRPLALLDGISMSVYPSEIVAIMGPSGAGKTTLLQCLTGERVPSHGSVRLAGIDVHRDFEQLRGLIGYVPQDDIVHADLTVYEALYYAARLRLPRDTTRAEIERRIDQVLDELGLGHRKHTRVGSVEEKTLSGGERKRVNLGMELIADPLIVLADEATSGLSSEDSREVLAALRRVADKGRPVIMTIHQPSGSLYRSIDHALVLARGGHVAFFGPTEPDSYAYFEGRAGEPESLLERLEQRLPTAWAATYRSSEHQTRWIHERSLPETGGGTAGPRQRPRGRMPLWTVLARTARLELGSLGSWARYLAPPAAIALLLLVLYDAFEDTDEVARNTPLFFLVVTSFFFGAFNAATKIVRERAVYRRERMAGLGLVGYALSKFLVLSAITTLQVIVVTVPVFLVLSFAGDLLPVLLVLALTGSSAVAAGLWLSTLVPRPEAAMNLIPILVVAELLLSGYFVALSGNDGSRNASAWLAAPMAARWAAQVVLDHEREGLASDLSDEGGSSVGDQPAASMAVCPTPTIESFMRAQGYGVNQRLPCWTALGSLVLLLLTLTVLGLWSRDPPVLRRAGR